MTIERTSPKPHTTAGRVHLILGFLKRKRLVLRVRMVVCIGSAMDLDPVLPLNDLVFLTWQHGNDELFFDLTISYLDFL